jgi:hypothetical protein
MWPSRRFFSLWSEAILWQSLVVAIIRNVFGTLPFEAVLLIVLIGKVNFVFQSITPSLVI